MKLKVKINGILTLESVSKVRGRRKCIPMDIVCIYILLLFVRVRISDIVGLRDGYNIKPSVLASISPTSNR